MAMNWSFLSVSVLILIAILALNHQPPHQAPGISLRIDGASYLHIPEIQVVLPDLKLQKTTYMSYLVHFNSKVGSVGPFPELASVIRQHRRQGARQQYSRKPMQKEATERKETGFNQWREIRCRSGRGGKGGIEVGGTIASKLGSKRAQETLENSRHPRRAVMTLASKRMQVIYVGDRSSGVTGIKHSRREELRRQHSARLMPQAVDVARNLDLGCYNRDECTRGGGGGQQAAGLETIRDIASQGVKDHRRRRPRQILEHYGRVPRRKVAKFSSDRTVPTGPNPVHNSNRSDVIP